MTKGKVSGSEIRKAVVLIRALDRKLGAQILGRLPRGMIESVTEQLARNAPIPEEETEAVLREFSELAGAFDGSVTTFLPPGDDRNPVANSLSEIEDAEQERLMPFAFLAHVEVSRLLRVLGAEHPQTVALVLSYLPAEMVTEFLSLIPEDRRRQISACLSVGSVCPDVLRMLQNNLRKRLNQQENEGESRIRPPVIQQIDQVSGQCQASPAESECSSHPTDFSDIFSLEADDLGILLQQCGYEVFTHALQGIEPSRRHSLLARLSGPARIDIENSLRRRRPLKLDQIQESQQQIGTVLGAIRQDHGERKPWA